LLLLRRLDKIAANLAAQDKKLADYKKTLPAKPLKQGLLQWIKKTACACARRGGNRRLPSLLQGCCAPMLVRRVSPTPTRARAHPPSSHAAGEKD
jgi:hypothetical protein